MMRRLVLAGSFVVPWLGLACGGGVNPAIQGREGMLSQTAIAKKCEEAKEGHDRPFVVEWDATDLSSFEAAARQRTMFVRYEGCSLKVLYECRDPNLAQRFGAYGQPELTSGTVQGFDIKNQGELYAKLPLGAASLSGKLEEGEALHLKYFVSGVATNTRESIYQNEIAHAVGCEGATHFVWGYNLGAFELDTQSRTQASVGGSYAGIGAGANGSREQASVARGGDIGTCTTQDQRGCRVPIRLALRPIRPGDNPLDQPGGGAVVAGIVAHANEQTTAMNAANEAFNNASRLFNEAHDGVGCLKQLDRALAIDPRNSEHRGVRFLYPRCLMRAGQCDEGMKRQRELLASEDAKRLKSDATLDHEVLDDANRECPSSTAKNDVDFALRAARELSEAAQAKNTDECRAGFDKLHPKARKAVDDAHKMRVDSKWSPNTNPIGSSLQAASKCIAEGGSCAEGLKYYKQWYCFQLRDKGCEKIAVESWETQKKLGHLTCK